jgi:hypothetical protein
MIDFLVTAVALFVVVFVAAWLRFPELRAWIERPKYRFQANVQRYDQMQRSAGNRRYDDLQGSGRKRGSRRSPGARNRRSA